MLYALLWTSCFDIRSKKNHKVRCSSLILKAGHKLNHKILTGSSENRSVTQFATLLVMLHFSVRSGSKVKSSNQNPRLLVRLFFKRFLIHFVGELGNRGVDCLEPHAARPAKTSSHIINTPSPAVSNTANHF